jgi:hypothetical protein
MERLIFVGQEVNSGEDTWEERKRFSLKAATCVMPLIGQKGQKRPILSW